MNIINSIRSFIVQQRLQGNHHKNIAFRFVPHIYLKFCDELRAANCSLSINTQKVNISDVTIHFDVISWTTWESAGLRNLEYNVELNNIIQKS